MLKIRCKLNDKPLDIHRAPKSITVIDFCHHHITKHGNMKTLTVRSMSTYLEEEETGRIPAKHWRVNDKILTWSWTKEMNTPAGKHSMLPHVVDMSCRINVTGILPEQHLHGSSPRAMYGAVSKLLLSLCALQFLRLRSNQCQKRLRGRGFVFAYLRPNERRRQIVVPTARTNQCQWAP